MDTRTMRILRAEKNMTQKELADLLGITVQAYNYAETGKRTLKVKTMIQYQQIMKLDDATMWRIWTGLGDKRSSR